MKILLFGKTGQLGSELERTLAPLGEVTAPARSSVDLEDLALLRSVVRGAKPGIVVNAAAYTNVDKAESDETRAERVNAEAVAVMSEEAARCGAWLVHYSTDYVFDGRQVLPYVENDPVQPLSVYGRTKLAGENAVRARAPRHFVFRTSWLYGERGASFPKTILALARTRDEIDVVADQHGAPTSAQFLAEVTLRALSRLTASSEPHTLAGTYHVAAAGGTSWYDYARYVLTVALRHGAALRAGPDRIRPVASADYPRAAARPASSSLDTSRLRAAFDIEPPDWHAGVARLVAGFAALEHA